MRVGERFSLHEDSVGFSASTRVGALFFLIFLDSLSYFLVMPALLEICLHSAGDFLNGALPISTRMMWYGCLVMVSPLGFVLASPYMGGLSDRVGRRRSLLICLIIAWVGFLLPLWGLKSHHLIGILLGRLLTGIASASQPIAQAAVADVLTGKRKALAMGWIGLAMTAAMVLGPLGGSAVIGFLGLQVAAPYLLGWVLVTLNGLVLWFGVKDQCRESGQSSCAIQDVKWNWRLVITPALVRLMIIFLCFELAWSLYYQVLYVYLPIVFKYSTMQVGEIAAFSGVWMGLGLTVLYKWALRRWTIAECLARNLVLMLLCFGVITLFGAHAWIHWLLIVPLSVAVGMAYPSVVALVSENVSAHYQGWALGMVSVFMGLSWMTTAFLSGWLMRWGALWPMLIATLFAGLAQLAWIELQWFERRGTT